MDNLDLSDTERAQAFAERLLGRPLTPTQVQVFLESVRVSNRAAERQARRIQAPVPHPSFSLAGVDPPPTRPRWWWQDEDLVMRVLSWVAMIAAYLLAAGFVLALVAQWWGAQ